MVSITRTLSSKYAFFSLATLLTLLSGCSTLPKPQSPIEDRTTATPQAQTHTTAKKSDTSQAETYAIPKPKKATVTAISPEKKRVKQAVPVPQAEIQTTPSNPAVVALLKQAKNKQQIGQLSSAQNTIQRAQRISPNDPEVYYALATINKELNDYKLAEQVALKGISIVQSKPKELTRFWLLLKAIYTESGNAAGIVKAEAQLNQL